MLTHLVSVLSALLALGGSPKSEESCIKDANGVEGVDWLDFLRERPNNGIRVIFFLTEGISSPDGTSKFLDVVSSF